MRPRSASMNIPVIWMPHAVAIAGLFGGGTKRVGATLVSTFVAPPESPNRRPITTAAITAATTVAATFARQERGRRRVRCPPSATVTALIAPASRMMSVQPLDRLFPGRADGLYAELYALVPEPTAF